MNEPPKKNILRNIRRGSSPIHKTPVLPLFTEESVICKMCGKSSTQKKVKSHLFVERDLDIDLRPKTITWTVNANESTNPAHFFMYTCPHCFFTASSVVFENPLRSINIPVTRFKSDFQNALDANPGMRTVLDELTKSIDSGSVNPFEAIRLHLLAIFHLQIVDEVERRDSLNLGRYSLRLAWLYEDLGENADLNAIFGPQLEAFFKVLSVQWPEVPNSAKKAHEMALRYYCQALEFSRAIDTTKEEVDLLLLIARVAMKLGELTVARRHIDRARDTIRKLEASRRSGKAPKDDAQVAADLRRMRSSSETVQIIFEKLQETKDKEDEARARDLVQKNPGKSIEELRALLASKNIDQKIINSIVPQSSKKKGFFGGLFGG